MISGLEHAIFKALSQMKEQDLQSLRGPAKGSSVYPTIGPALSWIADGPDGFYRFRVARG